MTCFSQWNIGKYDANIGFKSAYILGFCLLLFLGTLLLLSEEARTCLWRMGLCITKTDCLSWVPTKPACSWSASWLQLHEWPQEEQQEKHELNPTQWLTHRIMSKENGCFKHLSFCVVCYSMMRNWHWRYCFYFIDEEMDSPRIWLTCSSWKDWKEKESPILLWCKNLEVEDSAMGISDLRWSIMHDKAWEILEERNKIF